MVLMLALSSGKEAAAAVAAAASAAASTCCPLTVSGRGWEETPWDLEVGGGCAGGGGGGCAGGGGGCEGWECGVGG